jgi:MFS transporter, DHA1 family, solute carrier family 18 (vesicular amine transporter), member 1/2
VTPGPEATRRRVFRAAAGLIAVDTLLFSVIVPALPRFADRFGLSDAEAALVFAAFPVSQLGMAVVATWTVERFGRRPMMIGSALLALAATLVFAAAEHLAVLVLARAVQGGSAAFAWTAGIAAISDVFPPEQLGFRIGLAETMGGGAGLAGPILGGALIDAIGLDAAFLVVAALPLLVVPLAVTVPETRRPGAARARLGPAIRRLAREPLAQAGGVALALVAAVLALLEPLLPLDLDERLGLSSTLIGVVFAAGLAANFVAAPLAGRWSDRRGRRLPTVVGGVVLGLSLPLVAFGPAWWVGVAFALVGTGFATMAAPAGPLLVEAVDRTGLAGMYGLSAGVTTTIFAAGYAAGPLVGGGLRAALPFWVLTLATGALALLTTAWVGRRLARAGEPALAAGPKPGAALRP